MNTRGHRRAQLIVRGGVLGFYQDVLYSGALASIYTYVAHTSCKMRATHKAVR